MHRTHHNEIQLIQYQFVVRLCNIRMMLRLRPSKIFFLGVVFCVVISIFMLIVDKNFNQPKTNLRHAAIWKGKTEVLNLNKIQQNIDFTTSSKIPTEHKNFDWRNMDFFRRLQLSAGVADKPMFHRTKIVHLTSSTTSNSQRRNVIIVSQPRSGSSFLGQIFNQHPNVFYLFEPLRAVTKITNEDLYLNTPSENYNELATTFLSEILECRFLSSVYLEHLASFHRFSSKALSTYPLCNRENAMKTVTAKKHCFPLIGSMVENVCRFNYSFSVAKILSHRVPNQSITSLLSVCARSKSARCKVIHLVRDPRAMIFSQMKLNFMRRSPLKNGKVRGKIIRRHTQRICTQIHHNLMMIKNLPNDFLRFYELLRFEDLVHDLENVTRNLYRFTEIPFKRDVLNWIKINTHNAAYEAATYSPYSTRRNASAALNNWKRQLRGEDRDIIERCCKSVLKRLGYSSNN